MGLVAGLLFLGGIVASGVLVILAIVIHRRAATANGQSGRWFLFFLSSIGLTIVTIIVAITFAWPVFDGGPPTGDDYVIVMVAAALVGASPGVGTMAAALVHRSTRVREGQ